MEKGGCWPDTHKFILNMKLKKNATRKEGLSMAFCAKDRKMSGGKKKEKKEMKGMSLLLLPRTGGSGSFIRLVIKVALCPLSKIISGGWQFDEKEG